MKSITKKAMERYRSYLVESEKSAATVEKYLRDLRAFAACSAERNIAEGRVCFLSVRCRRISCVLRTFWDIPISIRPEFTQWNRAKYSARP